VEGVLFAAAYDCYPAQLTCNAHKLFLHAQWSRARSVHEPLWNFSSIGGTIWRTFLNSSLEAGDMVGLSDMAWMYVKWGGKHGIQGM